jgi:hypothetical protein
MTVLELLLREIGTGEAYAPKRGNPIGLLEDFLTLSTYGDLSPFVGSVCSSVLWMLDFSSENPESDVNLHIGFLYLFGLIRVHVIVQSQRHAKFDIAFKMLRASSDDRARWLFPSSVIFVRSPRRKRHHPRCDFSSRFNSFRDAVISHSSTVG